MNLPLLKPELLAPAGNPEKLEIAIHYGADAVYLAGRDFSLRNFSGNFSESELKQAIVYAHSRNVKVYVACNVFARNRDLTPIAGFLERIGSLEPDAVIVADPAVIHLARRIVPGIPLHLSTQANSTNRFSLEFWKQAGISRVNLARELSMNEIQEITAARILETEVFIHGAMCISYSGRCLLSSFLTGRDSNQGLCSHPCRWRYAVVEEKRPGEYHPVMEDNRGTYIFNSRDLCMIEHIPELMTANITAFKIEGRMKGISYLASVVKTYREAIDHWHRNPETFEVLPEWRHELNQVFNRDYCTGFFFNQPQDSIPNYSDTRKGRVHGFIGKVSGLASDGTPRVDIRNRICTGDWIEVLTPGQAPLRSEVLKIEDAAGHQIENARPNTRCSLKLDVPCQRLDIVRLAAS